MIDASDPPLVPPPDPKPRPARFTPPPGACDCHCHIVGEAETYPFTPNRSYTSPPAPLAAYERMLETLGLSRGVIVQPSFYGTDNRCTLDAVATAPERLRAVVVVDPSIEGDELRRMHEAGARGVRLNLLYKGGASRDDLETLAAKVAPLGWHVQLLIDVSQFEQVEATMRALPVPSVFDHVGHMPVARGLDHPGFRAMLRLLESGKSWVKVSGSYRITGETEPPYDDVLPFARAAIGANPERAVWGSDWPHPAVEIPMPNDGALLDMLADWVPEENLRHRILVDNPATLYGF